MVRDIESDGIRAEQLLDDELLRHMLAQAEANVVDALATLTVKQMTDHSVLITFVNQLQAVRAIPQMLRDTVASGKAATREPTPVV